MTVSTKLRESVRERAQGRCEYCQLPEAYCGRTHQVDHIIPQKHDGESTLNNLALACFQCNNMKSSEVAAYDRESGILTPFFNPRTQNWHDHFTIRDGEILGKTAIGRVTGWILDMNQSDRLETRKVLIEADLWD